MDPISILSLTGTIAGILDVLGRSLSGLYNLVDRYRHAALSIQLISSQLSTLRAALSQLLQWIDLAPSSLDSNQVLLNDLHVSISACSLLVQTLDSEIESARGEDVANPKVSQKLLVAFDTTCKERQMQLNHQVTALNLLLQAVSW